MFSTARKYTTHCHILGAKNVANFEIVLTTLLYILFREVSHPLWVPQEFFPPLQLEFPRSFSCAFNVSLSICLRFSRVPSCVHFGFPLRGYSFHLHPCCFCACFLLCCPYAFAHVFLPRSTVLLQTAMRFPCVPPALINSCLAPSPRDPPHLPMRWVTPFITPCVLGLASCIFFHVRNAFPVRSRVSTCYGRTSTQRSH